jgi:hypothetical protein
MRPGRVEELKAASPLRSGGFDFSMGGGSD